MEDNKSIKLDPRTDVLLLIISNIVIFNYSVAWIEYAYISFLFLLLLSCGCFSAVLKSLLVFVGIVFFQNSLILLPKFFVLLFSIPLVYARRIFPCILVGTLIIKTTTVSLLITALKKWKVPQSLTIPLSICLRYFPAIKEEQRYIRDSIKLRNIHGIFNKTKCLAFPIMLSAMNTADELSAAAITRGIENPCVKSSIIDLQFSIFDYLVLIIGLIFLIFVFYFN